MDFLTLGCGGGVRIVVRWGGRNKTPSRSEQQAGKFTPTVSRRSSLNGFCYYVWMRRDMLLRTSVDDKCGCIQGLPCQGLWWKIWWSWIEHAGVRSWSWFDDGLVVKLVEWRHAACIGVSIYITGNWKCMWMGWRMGGIIFLTYTDDLQTCGCTIVELVGGWHVGEERSYRTEL